MLGFLSAVLLGSACLGMSEFRKYKEAQGEAVYVPIDVAIEFSLAILVALFVVFRPSKNLVPVRKSLLLGEYSLGFGSRMLNFTHKRSQLFAGLIREKLHTILPSK